MIEKCSDAERFTNPEDIKYWMPQCMPARRLLQTKKWCTKHWSTTTTEIADNPHSFWVLDQWAFTITAQSRNFLASKTPDCNKESNSHLQFCWISQYISAMCVWWQFLTVTKTIIKKFRQPLTLADFMWWVTGGRDLRFVDKLSLLLQFDMQTCPQWSKSVHMETLQSNILLIFLIILTAHYPQKEGFVYWLPTAYRRCKIFFFFQTLMLQTLIC